MVVKGVVLVVEVVSEDSSVHSCKPSVVVIIIPEPLEYPSEFIIESSHPISLNMKYRMSIISNDMKHSHEVPLCVIHMVPGLQHSKHFNLDVNRNTQHIGSMEII